jgi:hypothetical protein
MQKTGKNIMIKALSFVMIGVAGLLIVNKALFIHTHQLSNGTIIVHAHPFDKSTDKDPIKEHQHTNDGLFFINHVDILFLVFVLALALAYLQFRSKFFVLRYLHFITRARITKNGRAPPYLCFY